jgi:hypothetical protein
MVSSALYLEQVRRDVANLAQQAGQATVGLRLIGRALTGQVNVSARLRASGTVGPGQPGALSSHYAGTPVTVGATGVDIVPKPQR